MRLLAALLVLASPVPGRTSPAPDQLEAAGRAGSEAGSAMEGARSRRSRPAVPSFETFGDKLDRYHDWITENADPITCPDLPRCLGRGAAAPVLITSYITAKVGYEGAEAGLATMGPLGGMLGGTIGAALGLAYGAVGGAVAAALAFIRAPFAALGLFEEEETPRRAR